MSRSKRFFICIAFTIALAATGYPQIATTSNSSTTIGGIAIPVKTGKLRRIDASALDEVHAHIAAVGATTWGGMQGTGTITYGSQDATAYDAILSNAGGNKFRLDAQTKQGTLSIRIRQFAGKIQDSNMRISTLDPDTASTGIFPFEILRTKAFPSPATSLIDNGLVNIEGIQLHRITYEYGSIGKNSLTHARNTAAIDFYFSPTSHLLVKSSASVLIDGTPRSHFLVVDTYSDYREVGSSMVPFRYTEIIDGQLSRTLQLTNVQLDPTLDSSYFDF